MEYMLSTHELGKLLSDLCNKYEISMLWREKISGGFITLTGIIDVEYYPTDKVMLKGNNIISLKVKSGNNSNVVKITGMKGEYFNISLAPTKFKEIKSNSLYLNQIQESKTECKLRIDENIIFTIPESYNEITKLIK
ncbi:UDP-N-acetylglucosamine pyrophosphorylase [Clostridium sp. NSJ-49]|uniref:Uncharacterized protein n=1 Tax=Clostridium disporicum TaxID=84024 RepID=A0A174E440_9CLOT|nr:MULTISPECIES: hypothetical protein [Clostridium]MBC5625853.1 UDP-N-acetylglucosamine pyrophosphorylase [Clostridium sp. NSJ-49]MCD2500362.1 UDP-N-acetylglucosamine pyrophosphorylase [Clostridium sp. NSJ-145]CUO31278.1 Uncharacterised protein [Clostridium disporicum]